MDIGQPRLGKKSEQCSHMEVLGSNDDFEGLQLDPNEVKAFVPKFEDVLVISLAFEKHVREKISSLASSLPLLPNYHVSLILAYEDKASVSAMEKQAIASLAHSLHSYLSRLGVRLRVSSRIYRGLHLSALYSHDNDNIITINTSSIHASLQTLDNVFAESAINDYENVYILCYKTAATNLLRTDMDIHTHNLTTLLSPNYISGFMYSTVSYQASFLIVNSFEEAMDPYLGAMIRQIKRHIGLLDENYQCIICGNIMLPEGKGFKVYHSPHASINISAWDIFIMQRAWITKGIRDGTNYPHTFKELQQLPHHRALSPLIISQLDHVTSLMPQIMEASEVSFPLNAKESFSWTVYNSTLDGLNRMHSLVSDPGLVDLQQMSWELSLLQLAPFWMPLLAPLIKWILAYRKAKRAMQMKNPS
jgi:hypothetical protein